MVLIIQTKEFREATVELQEDMVEEQQEARIEGERLKNEIATTSEKINEQRIKNLTRKGQVEFQLFVS